MDKDSYSEDFIVKEQDCISEISSSLPSVLGTYILVKWMETVSARLINKQIDTQKYMTMGKRVDIEHGGMAKRGEEIMIKATVVEQSKREILLRVVAMLGDHEIAIASHTRIVISKKVLSKMMGEI